MLSVVVLEGVVLPLEVMLPKDILNAAAEDDWVEMTRIGRGLECLPVEACTA